MNILEIVPEDFVDLREHWAEAGILSVRARYDEVLYALNGPRGSIWFVDAIVIHGTDAPRESWDSPQTGAPGEVFALAEAIRDLPPNLAMPDGRQWRALPLLHVCQERLLTDTLEQLHTFHSRVVGELEVIVAKHDNQYAASDIQRSVETYRMSVLAELDDLGLVVSYKRGRYTVGPAFHAKRQLEGKYYWGPADRNRDRVVTLHKDQLGIQLEVEQFEALINNSDVSEQQLQEFFEEHPHFLSKEHIAMPHVRFKKRDGEVLIPDFILKPLVAEQRDSSWNLLELKLPKQKLLAGRGTRATVSAHITRAIRQLRDYQEQLQNPDFPEAIESLLGHKLKHPTLGVLIGRLSNTDVEALEREQKHLAGVKIVTYDEILQTQQRLLGG